MKKAMVLAALLTMVGCATQAGFVKLMDAQVGRDINDIISERGAPNSTFTMPNGNIIYTYDRSRLVSIPSQQMPSTAMTTYSGNTAYTTVTPGAIVGGGVAQISCRIDLTVSASKVITYRFEGNGCRAKEA